MKTKYVLGFMFSMDGARVAVIRKARPNWMAGKRTGIGGHIEEGEIPIVAMTREFWEETGVHEEGWELRAYSQSNNHEMFIYRCFSESIDKVSTVTDEPVEVVTVESMLKATDIIENTRFLIPYLLDRRAVGSAKMLRIEY